VREGWVRRDGARVRQGRKGGKVISSQGWDTGAADSRITFRLNSEGDVQGGHGRRGRSDLICEGRMHAIQVNVWKR
jgi:hypothetical protein